MERCITSSRKICSILSGGVSEAFAKLNPYGVMVVMVVMLGFL